MITVYEIKPNGFIGASKEIDPREGISQGWTYTPPPADGSHKWEMSQWVAAEEPEEAVPGPDIDALASSIRTDRNKRLAETDWRFRTDMTPSQEWVDYCQALRDITAQAGFPLEVQWPTQPE
jgi:hypothetical protein